MLCNLLLSRVITLNVRLSFHCFYYMGASARLPRHNLTLTSRICQYLQCSHRLYRSSLGLFLAILATLLFPQRRGKAYMRGRSPQEQRLGWGQIRYIDTPSYWIIIHIATSNKVIWPWGVGEKSLPFPKGWSRVVAAQRHLNEGAAGKTTLHWLIARREASIRRSRWGNSEAIVGGAVLAKSSILPTSRWEHPLKFRTYRGKFFTSTTI